MSVDHVVLNAFASTACKAQLSGWQLVVHD